MSRTDDTDNIIADGGSTVMTIKSVSFLHSSIPPIETATVVDTATVYIDPGGGSFKRIEKGEIISKMPTIYMSDTVTVDVGNRLYSGSTVDYYEVLAVRKYEGHKEVDVKQVRGR
ncbi:MAG TPA: hypothetical protein VIY48_19815 [Candidatus Paceibacterota bacterium]